MNKIPKWLTRIRNDESLDVTNIEVTKTNSDDSGYDLGKSQEKLQEIQNIPVSTFNKCKL